MLGNKWFKQHTIAQALFVMNAAFGNDNGSFKFYTAKAVGQVLIEIDPAKLTCLKEVNDVPHLIYAVFSFFILCIQMFRISVNFIS